MVRKIIIAITLISLYSCAKTQTLKDGTKTLSKKFKNQEKFDNKIYDVIDDNFFYQEMDHYFVNKNYVKTRSIENSRTSYFLQFYPNGRIRFIQTKEPDPDITGRRGVIYLKGDMIKLDTQFSNQGGAVSKGTYSVRVIGDKLYLYDDNSLGKLQEFICHVFVKSERIPEDWKKFRVSW